MKSWLAFLYECVLTFNIRAKGQSLPDIFLQFSVRSGAERARKMLLLLHNSFPPTPQLSSFQHDAVVLGPGLQLQLPEPGMIPK